MKIKVEKNKIEIEKKDIINKGEYKINKCYFEFSENYSDDLVKKALFTVGSKAYEMVIINNECDIPPEVLKERTYVFLGVYAYKLKDEKLELRYSPSPDAFLVDNGSYEEGAISSEEIPPTQFEQYQQALQNSLNALKDEIESAKEIGNIIQQQGEKVELQGNFAKEQGIFAKETVSQILKDKENGIFNGKDGRNGENGATFKPIISEDGTLSWSNNKGLENPIPKNVIGPQGPEGKQGIEGPIGPPGKKPVKGVDYFTEEEQEKFANDIANGANSIFNQNAENKTIEFNNHVSKKELEFANNIDAIIPKEKVKGKNLKIEDALNFPVFSARIEGQSTQNIIDDFEQDIKNLSFSNLYNYKDVMSVSEGITTDSDGWITVNFDNSQGASRKFCNYYTNISNLLKTNKNYNVFLEVKSVSGSGIIYPVTNATPPKSQFDSNWPINFSDLSNGIIMHKICKANANFDASFTMLRTVISFDVGQSGTIKFRISVFENTELEINNFKYIPYGFIALENRGKNLFDENNTFVGNINTETKKIAGIASSKSLFVPITGGKTYTISKKISARFVCGTCDEFPNYGVTVNNIVSNSNVESLTITTNVNNKYLVAWYYTSTYDTEITEQEILDSIQVEEGPIATKYESFCEQKTILDLQENFVGALPDGIKDYLVLKKNKFFIEKNIGKMLLTGNENWLYEKIEENLYKFSLLIDDATSKRGRSPVLSNRFLYKGTEEIYGNVFISEKYLYLYSDLTTLEDFQAWLLQNPTEIYYPLESTQIIELGILEEPFTTFEGENNIRVLANLETEVEVEYALNIKKYIDSLYLSSKENEIV